MTFKDQRKLDLDVFTHTDEFGIDAILSENGVETPIKIVKRTQPDDLKGMDHLITIFSIKLSDAPHLNKDTQFIVDDTVFRILNLASDYGEDPYPKIVVTEVE